jgi:hypothetical protein
MTVFWGCCAVLSGRNLGTFRMCLHPPSSERCALMLVIVIISEMWVNFFQNTWPRFPGDNPLQTRRLENLKSYHRLVSPHISVRKLWHVCRRVRKFSSLVVWRNFIRRELGCLARDILS